MKYAGYVRKYTMTRQIKLFLIVHLVFTIVIFSAPTSSHATTVNYAAAINNTYLPDLTVNIVEGITASIQADEKWEIVGVCSNSPNINIKILTGISAITSTMDLNVEIVTGISAIVSADKKVCITNPETLDNEILRKLKLN